jgi:hypothetical protein
MTAAGNDDLGRLAELLAELAPAPAAWVDAAAEMPRLKRDLEQIVGLAETDLAFRAAVVADLESALRGAGMEPTPALVAAVRRQRLAGKGRIG